MSMEPSENQANTKDLRERLDRLLSHHFERITGTRSGIHGLPLTLTSVACIVLLADREEEAGQETQSTLRYHQTDLEQALEEMGVNQGASLHDLLAWLQENGYVEVDAKGRLMAGKPTISMAHLLEHAFPGMPGLNLVAYFIQTLEEVESERKPVENAFSQLDQTLQRHSAGPFRKSSSPASKPAGRPGTPPGPRSAPGSRPPSPAKPKFVSPIRFQSPASKSPSMSEDSGSADPAASTPAASGGDASNLEQEKPPLEGTQAMESPLEEASSPDPEALPDTSPGEVSEPLDASYVPEEGPETDEGARQEAPHEAVDGAEAQDEGDEVAARIEKAPEDAPRPEPFVEEETGAEDRVEKRIAAFEEKLAMQCPVCRQAYVQEKKTAKGKTYYTCTDEQCVFISWGRPHHVECPRCRNPFLVESTSSDGEIVLKCPRATCRHKQPLHAGTPGEDAKGLQPSQGIPKPCKKRVVRRKRVRRKR